MSEPTVAERSALQRIGAAMAARAFTEAATLAAELVRARPDLALAHYASGVALAATGQTDASETSLHEAIRLDPTLTWAAVRLGLALVHTGRAAEARAVIAPYVERPDADMNVLTVEALALKFQLRSSEATAAYLRARDAAPTNPLAEQNLAAHYGDLQRHADSAEASRRAFAKGLDAPELWLVHARALKGLGRIDEAEAAFGEAIRRRPDFVDAHGELAQLIWLRTADLDASSQALDQAVAAFPDDPDLRLRRATLLEYAGQPRAAYASLTAAPPAVRSHPLVAAAAATLAAGFDPAAALDHARRAFAAAPDEINVVIALCQAQIAAGDAAAAAETALILRRRWPLNQHGIALLATAWRILGVAQYRDLYDYDRLVRRFQLEAPSGWRDIAGYVSDLAGALERTHRFSGHPIGQSLRGGTQGELSPEDPDPAIAAFFPTVRKAIGRYIAELGPGADPLRARRSEHFGFNGAWSVRLRSGGHHANHIHPLGWISSACHLVIPPGRDQGHEGWLSFGQPGIPTEPMLPPEHHVRPEPGVLVLFPSYIWHGTEPFLGEGIRLTAAFDVAPG